eukprot:scaffold2353_cov167-Amphora_coffeaeformis.AAC.35
MLTKIGINIIVFGPNSREDRGSVIDRPVPFSSIFVRFPPLVLGDLVWDGMNGMSVAGKKKVLPYHIIVGNRTSADDVDGDVKTDDFSVTRW